jgi:hypothetical protein
MSSVVALTSVEPAAPQPRHLRLVERRPHGTRSRYVVERCRCRSCRSANTAYWRERRRHPSPLVDATPVREHLEWLASRGIGKRAIAAATGLHTTVIVAIRSGRRRRITIGVGEALLAVSVQDLKPLDGALVDAGDTWRRIEQLVAAGRTRAWIARQLGAPDGRLRLGRERVTASTARAIERLAQVEGELVKAMVR